jgi:hypothetical protein
MNNKTYDTFAWIGRILLPALAVLYTTVGKLWNLPYINEIPATMTAIAVFINAILKANSDKFFEDKEIVQSVDEK